MKRIMTKMVDRRLLEVDKKRVLKLLMMTSRYYVLPEQTSALTMLKSARLLEESRQTRPDVGWRRGPRHGVCSCGWAEG